MKNEPPKWKQISEAARYCGAQSWAMRKWLQRGRIPPAWQIKINKHSRGRIKFEDMVVVEHEKPSP